MRFQPEAVPLVERSMFQSQQGAFPGVVPGTKVGRVDDLEVGMSPFEYELPKTPKGIITGWITRLQAVAVVTALLAQVEASFIGGLPERVPDPPASDTVLRFFVYSATILNLSATLSAILLLLAITEIPTSARRMYMYCKHSFPRKLFNSPLASIVRPQPDEGTHRTTDPSTLYHPHIPVLEDLNRRLLRGDSEGKLLREFGVASGWDILLRHCIFCFLAGCVSSFVHLCLVVWVSETRLVAALAMPIALIGFVPPLVIYSFAWNPPRFCLLIISGSPPCGAFEAYLPLWYLRLLAERLPDLVPLKLICQCKVRIGGNVLVLAMLNWLWIFVNEDVEELDNPRRYQNTAYRNTPPSTQNTHLHLSLFTRRSTLRDTPYLSDQTTLGVNPTSISGVSCIGAQIQYRIHDTELTTSDSNNPYYNYNYQVPNPPPPVSVGEKLLKLFKDAESERANVFISTIRQFNTEFNEAQLSRSQDDRRLAEDFRTFLVGIQTTFSNSRGRYTELFERIELERDKAFDAKLEEMAKLAKEADDHRKEDFDSALEGFKKYAEVAMKVRFELFEQGRKERVGMVDGLVHSVRERCVEILESETEAYNALQRERREKILRYATARGIHPNISEEDAGLILEPMIDIPAFGAYVPGAYVSALKGTTEILNQYRLGDHSGVLQYKYAGLTGISYPTGQGYGPNEVGSDLRAQHVQASESDQVPPLSLALYHRQVELPPNFYTIAPLDQSFAFHRDISEGIAHCDSIFSQEEHNRQQSYTFFQASKRQNFEEAETSRDAISNERKCMFRDIKNSHVILLKQLQEKCNTVFFTNQSRKDKLVSQLSEDNSSRNMFAKHFSQALSLFSEELKLLETVYSNLLTDTQSHLEHCFQVMGESIDEALEKQTECYSTSQTFYITLLSLSQRWNTTVGDSWENGSVGFDEVGYPGIPGLPQIPSGIGYGNTGQGYGVPLGNDGRTHWSGGDGRTSWGGEDGKSKRPWHGIFTNLLNDDTETQFAPRTLFKFSLTSSKKFTVSPQFRETEAITQMLQKHFKQFEDTQELRRNEFKSFLQSCQDCYLSNKGTRNADLLDQQNMLDIQAKSLILYCDEIFDKDQEWWQRESEQLELKRANSFITSETTKSKQFLTDQKERSQDFYHSQESLHARVLGFEQEQQGAMDEQERSAEEAVQKWESLFRSQAELHENSFQKLLSMISSE